MLRLYNSNSQQSNTLSFPVQDEPALFGALLGKIQGTRSDWEYPFAVAGVNITFALQELLELRDRHAAQPLSLSAWSLHTLEVMPVLQRGGGVPRMSTARCAPLVWHAKAEGPTVHTPAWLLAVPG